MKRSVHTYRTPRRTATTPATTGAYDLIGADRAEFQRLAGLERRVLRGEWDEDLLWRYTTDPELRALCAVYGLAPVVALEGVST